MNEDSLLEGKKILIVDDEQDVLDMLEELLPMCEITKATNFEEAKMAIEKRHFDMAVLDIMGVRGYELLELANEKNIIAVMLTAHSLTPQDVFKSYNKGAASYIPKGAISKISVYLNDILEAKKHNKSLWWRWRHHFSRFFKGEFGLNWEDQYKEYEDFWEEYFKNKD
jgi:DNA-binding NtrC family response regulator